MEFKRIGEEKTVEAGFTLVEVIIAIFLLAVGILGMASMQVMALQGNSFAGNISESIFFANSCLHMIDGTDDHFF